MVIYAVFSVSFLLPRSFPRKSYLTLLSVFSRQLSLLDYNEIPFFYTAFCPELKVFFLFQEKNQSSWNILYNLTISS